MSRFNKVLAFISFFGILLTGCNVSTSNSDAHNPGENSGDNSHRHHLVLKHDFESHWAECEECGHKYDVSDDEDKIYDDDSKNLINTYGRRALFGEPHIFESSSEIDKVCEICHAHFHFELGYDENEHWESIVDLDYGTSEERMRESHSYDEEIIEPTYESLGYTIKTCYCGYSYKTNYVDKLEHHYSDLMYDNEHHWRQCTDEGYDNLTIDYSAHIYGETIHRYHEGDIQGDYTYHVCECGYQENIEYEYSPLELKTAEYLTGIQLQYNSWWYAIQLNEKALLEEPQLLVIPPYLDGYLVNGISYSTGGFEYGLSAQTADFIKKIYFPIHLYEKSTYGLSDGGFTKVLDKLESLEEIHCHPSSEMREEDGVVYYRKTAYFFFKSKDSITFKNCDKIYSYSSSYSDLSESIFYNRPNLKYVYVDDSCRSIQRLSLAELSNYTNILLNEKPASYYLGNDNGNDYSYCVGYDNDATTYIPFDYNCRIIGENAYKNFSALSEISISNNIIEIGRGAFENCTSISRVTYSGTIESWNSITNYGFHGVSNLVIHCSDGDVTL